MVELTQARLLERPGGTWLERNEIDRILAEHDLSTSFASDSPNKRVALGQLLKADLLVLIRKTEKRIDLVVAETNGGLRILAHSIPESDDVESDTERLVGLVAKAMAKYGETIREIYAVPPFLSRDLGTDNDHLTSAYAVLVERALLAQPGVLVVETAEAEAIWREYALTAPDNHPTRRLPIYLWGEYRHEGYGDSREITIGLETRRGETVLRRSSHTMRPQDAPAYLEQASAGLLEHRSTAAVDFDAETEAQGLVQRTGEFLQLRDWQRALTLAELSVLLVPDRLEARTAAILAISRLRQDLNPNFVGNKSEIPRLRQRSLCHLKNALASEQADKVSMATINTAINNPWLSQDLGPQPTSETRQLREDERDFALKMAYRYADRAAWRKSQAFFLGAIARMTPERDIEERLSFLAKYQHTMDPHFMYSITSSAGASHDEMPTLWRKVLAWQDVNEVLKNKILKHQRELIESTVSRDERRREEREWESLPSTPAEPSSALTFRRLNPASKGENDSIPPLTACLPLDDGSDVLWRPSKPVYHITTPDTAEVIWDVFQGDTCYAPLEVAADGRYLWIVSQSSSMRGSHLELHGIDSRDGHAWRIGKQHGLPTVDFVGNSRKRPKIKVVPLRDGEAIIVGHQDDTWLAHARFDPSGNHQVKVFHEAKEIHSHEPNAPLSKGHDNSWANPHISFLPQSIAVFTDPKSGRQRIAVSRSIPDVLCSAFRERPLIVDPDNLSVSVADQTWTAHCWNRVYLQYFQGRLKLMYRDSPEGPAVEFVSNVLAGHIVVNGDTIHVVGRQWQQGNLRDRSWQSLGTTPWECMGPWDTLSGPRQKRQYVLLDVYRTNVYGLVVVLGKTEDRQPLLMAQVLFDGSGVPFEQLFSP